MKAKAKKLDQLVFGRQAAPPARGSRRYESDGRRVGAKWEQKTRTNQRTDR